MMATKAERRPRKRTRKSVHVQKEENKNEQESQQHQSQGSATNETTNKKTKLEEFMKENGSLGLTAEQTYESEQTNESQRLPSDGENEEIDTRHQDENVETYTAEDGTLRVRDNPESTENNGQSSNSCSEDDAELNETENSKEVAKLNKADNIKQEALADSDDADNANDNCQCDICGKTCLDKYKLKRHKYLHILKSRPKHHACAYEGCDRRFHDAATLTKHVKAVHLNIRNYLCEFCVTRCKTLSTLKAHINAFHTKKENKKTHTCNLCNRTFMNSASVQDHRCLETYEETFICTWEGCGKTFRLQSYLTKHQKVHKGEKPHQCEICKERFTRRTYMESHMYKHTGIKAFSCEECGKFFTQRGNLRTHMLIHNNKRPVHACPECGHTFTLKCNLKKHLQKHVKMEEIETGQQQKISRKLE